MVFPWSYGFHDCDRRNPKGIVKGGILYVGSNGLIVRKAAIWKPEKQICYMGSGLTYVKMFVLAPAPQRNTYETQAYTSSAMVFVLSNP